MIDAETLSSDLATYIGSEVRASETDDRRVALLTPVDRPDGEGVVVYVEGRTDGYFVSDLGLTDASLAGVVSERGLTGPARKIARMFDVAFSDGIVSAHAAERTELVEACWRVAQAAAAIAAAPGFMAREQARRRSEVAEALAAALVGRGVVVQRDVALRGISDHTYRASLFLPDTHLVVEPIDGGRTFTRARHVVSEFVDLGRVNGHRFLAVLDDRGAPLDSEAALLESVAKVERWTRHEQWVPGLGAR